MRMKTGSLTQATLGAMLVLCVAVSSLHATPVTDGLELWLDANDAGTFSFASGSQVSQWRDKSPNANHAGTSGNYPTLQPGVIGGMPAVNFKSTQGGAAASTPLTIAGGLNVGGNQDRTTFMVMNYGVQIGNNEVFGVTTVDMVDVGSWNSPRRLRLRGGGNNTFSPANSLPTGSHLVAIQGDAAGSKAWSDGAQIINSSNKHFHWAMNTNMQVGGANFASRSYHGNLAELIVYDRALSANEMNAVGYSLQQKYSLAGTYTAPLPDPVLPVTSGLELWLDATDRSTLTLSGAEVTQWDDKSPNANHATAGAMKRPTLSLGGIDGQRDALYFSRDQMTVNGLTIGDGDPRTIFVMMDYDFTSATNNSEILGTNTTQMIDVGTWTQSQRLRLRDAGHDGDVMSAPGSVPSGKRILVAQALPSGTSAWSDGLQIISAPGDHLHNDLTGAFGIGGAFFNGREYIGNLAEVLIFDRVLSADELNAVGYYFESKYGLDTEYVEPVAVIPEPCTVVGWAVLTLCWAGAKARRRRKQ